VLVTRGNVGRNAEGKCLDRTEVTHEDALKDATLTTWTVVKHMAARPSVRVRGRLFAAELFI